ncbi:MAG: hypothetical protein AAFX06_18935 [Planctomycetota bacterium]
MPIQLDPLFSGGGRPMIDLLSHCVRSVNTDALLLYFVNEYRLRPFASAAIALYDVFCSLDSAGCIHERSMIAPRDLRLQQSIEPLRSSLNAIDRSTREPASPDVDNETVEGPQADADAEMATVVGPPMPPPYLFDHVCRAVRSGSHVRELEMKYDVTRSPNENLPGGEMSASQRAFVDNTWTPHIRPYLAAAGFWRVTTIG